MGRGEALVALQFVLKPAVDELFMTQFGRLARELVMTCWIACSFLSKKIAPGIAPGVSHSC